jgi:hypothetical protein
VINREKLNEKIEVWSLMLAMFFLPFGYDALFKLVMDFFHSYWVADVTFYTLSAILFGIHYIYRKKNRKKSD